MFFSRTTYSLVGDLLVCVCMCGLPNIHVYEQILTCLGSHIGGHLEFTLQHQPKMDKNTMFKDQINLLIALMHLTFSLYKCQYINVLMFWQPSWNHLE